MDLGIEGVLLKIPTALKIRKPGYPRPRVSFSYFALHTTSVRKHGLCCARAFRDRPAPRMLYLGSKTNTKYANARVSFSYLGAFWNKGKKENARVLFSYLGAFWNTGLLTMGKDDDWHSHIVGISWRPSRLAKIGCCESQDASSVLLQFLVEK